MHSPFTHLTSESYCPRNTVSPFFFSGDRKQILSSHYGSVGIQRLWHSEPVWVPSDGAVRREGFQAVSSCSSLLASGDLPISGDGWSGPCDDKQRSELCDDKLWSEWMPRLTITLDVEANDHMGCTTGLPTLAGFRQRPHGLGVKGDPTRLGNGTSYFSITLNVEASDTSRTAVAVISLLLVCCLVTWQWLAKVGGRPKTVKSNPKSENIKCSKSKRK